MEGSAPSLPRPVLHHGTDGAVPSTSRVSASDRTRASGLLLTGQMMSFQDTAGEESSGSTLVAPPPLPASAEQRAPAISFYKINSSKLRLREWWRSTGVLTALVGWGLGRLGGNLAVGQRAHRIPDWREAEVSFDELPATVRDKFAGRTSELWNAGFRDPVFYHLVNRFNGYEDYAAIFASASGESFARIFWSRALPGRKIRERFETAFLTTFADGRRVWTCDQPQRFDFPPEIVAQHRRGASVDELIRRHDDAVAQTADGAAMELVDTPERLRSVYSSYESADFRFHEQRGLFVAPTAAEATRDAELSDAERTAGLLGSRFGAAWAELQHAQTQKPSAINGVVLLAVTILASVTIGFGQASGKTLAIILGALFFHELGHYLAMRAFKYRNLKMFFIPGLGAAVSGRHYNVAGWKRAIVSLLGPIPGIWVGAAIGAWAIAAGNSLLAEMALIVMGLNVFNLLPIVPLDGGWYWNAVLFSRSRWLELAFKGFAGLCGVGASSIGFGRIWMFLGIVTLMTLPAVWLQGSVAASLLRRGFTPAAGDDDTVPFDTAEKIFGELETLGKGKFNAKDMATHALQVFERLNAVPPNWLETLGLSAVYFVSIIAASSA